DGSRVARNYDGSDIFLPLYDPDLLHIRVLSPALEPTFLPSPATFYKVAGEELEVKAIASKPADLSLFLNGKSFQSSSNDISISSTVKLTGRGHQVIEAKASRPGIDVNANVEFVITGEVEQAEIPTEANLDGFTRLNNGMSVIMTLYAP